MFDNNNVLVTGGAGFIGYHICDQYLKNGVHTIVIYDNMSSGRLENVSDLAEKYPDKEVILVIGDILETDKLKKAMVDHNITMCNHHAAQLEITKCISNPKFDVDTNLIGTLSVLDAMLSAGVKILINASSACVYGQNDTERPSMELTDHPKPHWVYGMSKYAAEQLISIYCHDYGIKAVSFRYSIVMGTREWFGRAGTMFIKRALGGDKLVIFGDGSQIRDIIDVEDAALANVNVLSYLNNMEYGEHEVFNISSQTPYTVNYMAESALMTVYGYLDIDMIVYDDPKPGDYSNIMKDRVRIPNELKVMWLDNSRMVNKLNVIPSITLMELFKKEAEWLLRDTHKWDEYHI